MDAFKHAAVPLVGDARAVLEELMPLVAGYRVGADYASTIAQLKRDWDAEVERICSARLNGSRSSGQSGSTAGSRSTSEAEGARAVQASDLLTQAEVIGVLQQTLAPTDVIVCAAGSLPGDLHKLWRARDPKGYHLEYGYSCMGYEIAGGLGVKMAAPDRGVYVLVGDGSYLMMAQEIVTAVQEAVAITIVLFDNHGFASIGGLSESVGSGGFGTRYRHRSAATGELDGDLLPVDLAANAASLGARVCRAASVDALREALAAARNDAGPTVIVVRVDRESRVGGYESWWDVPVAEVSTMREVQQARAAYERSRRKARDFL
jgi:3D-(3,5/4)-trihydroxycyclohexane-1,2-dione acylhydrolase (decyclizing)